MTECYARRASNTRAIPAGKLHTNRKLHSIGALSFPDRQPQLLHCRITYGTWALCRDFALINIICQCTGGESERETQCKCVCIIDVCGIYIACHGQTFCGQEYQHPLRSVPPSHRSCCLTKWTGSKAVLFLAGAVMGCVGFRSVYHVVFATKGL